MKQQILSQSGHTTYGIREFVIDTDNDIENLPIDIPMGSAALSIESGNVFILNSKDEWKNVGGGNGQSSGSGGPGISAAVINDQGHLIITTTAGTTYDAGLAKGADGESFTFDELTEEQKAELKGKPFTYEDFTEQQLNNLNGKSAYELAYAADSTIGTESQWLASLKGPKGDSYNLTNNDKADIADIAATIVRSWMEAAEGASF